MNRPIPRFDLPAHVPNRRLMTQPTIPSRPTLGNAALSGPF